MSDDIPSILLVDDDLDIRDALHKYLSQAGFRVSCAAGSEAARRHLHEASPDIVILDIMMPGEDGLSLCRYLHENNGPPVIMLTALGDTEDRIAGLDIGADDYLAKPFNPRELVARIQSVLRRSVQVDRPSGTGRKLSVGNWVVNAEQAELTHESGEVIALSANELALLQALLAKRGKVVSREELMEKCRGRAPLPFERSIDNMIVRLRRKIEDDPSSPRLIKTVWGGGYLLAGNGDGAP